MNVATRAKKLAKIDTQPVSPYIQLIGAGLLS